MRAFVALPLPGDLRELLAARAAHVVGGHPVSGENMHLTLGFLGEVSDEALHEFHEAFEGHSRPMRRLGAPGVAIRGFGVFGDPARVLFADVAANEALSELAGAVRGAAFRAGITLKHQRFHPHITIRRFARHDGADPVFLARFLTIEAGFAPPDFAVHEAVLYRSRLLPSGAQYTPLATYPLAP